MAIPCILIPALVGIISGILGYLIGKTASKEIYWREMEALQSDFEKCIENNKRLNAKIISLESELKIAKTKAIIKKQNAVLKKKAGIPYDAKLAFTVLGKKWKQDDLKIVEGIGAKIKELLNQAGIKTWYALSKTSVEDLQTILDVAGPKYKLHNPGTWPQQANLAYEGKWQELKELQETLT